MTDLDAILLIEGQYHTPNEFIDAMAQLIRSGVVWNLQGSYGRVAADLIEGLVIASNGDVLKYPDSLED